MKVFLFTFSFINIYFKCLQNLGKYLKPNCPIKVWKTDAFSQNLLIQMQKNSNATFFRVGGSIKFWLSELNFLL